MPGPCIILIIEVEYDVSSEAKAAIPGDGEASGYPGYLDALDENSRLLFISFDITSLIKRMEKVLLPN